MKNGLGNGFFITGTDTDIGKTYVSRLLADTFAESMVVTYMKPVQTGCRKGPGQSVIAPDFEYVMQGHAVQVADLDDHVPYRFEPACSPHLAASLEGATISLDHIRDRFIKIADKKSITIVEGAGGVLSPLSETTSMIDLILHLGLPVVVVTSPRLGTLNHTFLTMNTLSHHRIDVAGIVVNNRFGTQENYIYHDTIRMFRDHLHETALLEAGFEEIVSHSVKEFCNALLKKI